MYEFMEYFSSVYIYSQKSNVICDKNFLKTDK